MTATGVVALKVMQSGPGSPSVVSADYLKDVIVVYSAMVAWNHEGGLQDPEKVAEKLTEHLVGQVSSCSNQRNGVLQRDLILSPVRNFYNLYNERQTSLEAL